MSTEHTGTDDAGTDGASTEQQDAERPEAEAVEAVEPETIAEAQDAELEDEPDEDAEDEDRDEGDIAADYIEELLDIADVDGDLEIDEQNGRTYVSVTADGESNLSKLSSGPVVEALQQLTRLAVQAETGEFSRLILDVGGSRDARRRELEELVVRAVQRIEEGAATAALPPMSSYERKIVHDLAADRGYLSESEGEGRDRHTVLQAPAADEQQD
ncbi:R3H domain-containing nucleic acid-binding protein [Gulosibacter sp. 10]|uniref:Jag family protein n=1 Tax=Gulosibacter sp. 10 TaxID=1255570 RepID=UPI00097EAB8E|nr:R3H domain-containing nucleic acid-binding protein [Gulosibacter sp. 10]SJM63337.1 RNA-binding protein Jag [Gulosibacter sp. 10]